MNNKSKRLSMPSCSRLLIHCRVGRALNRFCDVCKGLQCEPTLDYGRHCAKQLFPTGSGNIMKAGNRHQHAHGTHEADPAWTRSMQDTSALQVASVHSRKAHSDRKVVALFHEAPQHADLTCVRGYDYDNYDNSWDWNDSLRKWHLLMN